MAAPIAQLRRAADLINTGQPDQAVALLLPLARLHPRDPDVAQHLMTGLAFLGRFQEALQHGQVAFRSRPEDPDLLVGIANVYLGLKLFDGANEILRRALHLDPRHVEARLSLLDVLTRQDHLVQLERIALDGIALNPAIPDYHLALCVARQCTGRPEEAAGGLEHAAALHPDHTLILSSAANAMTYHPTAEPAALLAAHRRFGEFLDRVLPPSPRPPITDPDPDRIIRVGVLSPDLRSHSVAYMIAWLFEHFDRNRLHLTAYSTAEVEDDISAKLRAWASAWRHFPTQSDEQVLSAMKADRIDILLELSGHTRFFRLPLLQRRPAPIQITYMGYAATTGVGTVDYRLVDSSSDPPDLAPHSTESLLRMDPCWPALRHLVDLPPVQPPPCTRHPYSVANPGPITFGCLSSLQKVNDFLFRAWAPIFRELPDARLLIKGIGLAHPDSRDHVRRRLDACGLPIDRVDLEAPVLGAAALLPNYHRIDIALDSFPYHGVLTAGEANLMGVPVVSLIGATSCARTALAISAGVGLGDLCAGTPAELARIAVGLARNVPRLVEIRTTLRDRFLASPMGDPAAAAARFERALRTAWRERCEAARAASEKP